MPGTPIVPWFFVLIPPTASAQAPLERFANVSSSVKRRTIVFVTNARGEQVKGKITELSPTSLELITSDRHEDRLTFTTDQISRVTRVDSRLNGFLIGAGRGGGAGGL